MTREPNPPLSGISHEPARAVTLYDQLLDERMQVAQEAAQKVAIAAASPIPQHTTILHSIESQGGTMCGTDLFARSRTERHMIDQAAEYTGWSVTNTDEDKTPTASKETIAWHLDKATHIQTVWYTDPSGGFRDNLAQVIAEYSEPFESMKAKLTDGEMTAQTEQEFDLSPGNIDTVATFMDLGDIEGKGEKFKAILLKKFYDLPVYIGDDVPSPLHKPDGVYFDTEGNLVKILKEVRASQQGVSRGLYFAPSTRQDPSEASFKLGIEINPERAAKETYQGGGSEVSEPFLFSTSGKAFVGVIESLGLKMAPRLRNILVGQTKSDEYDKRYGNGYSEITREIAKIINNPERQAMQLFVDEGDAVRTSLEGLDLAAIEPESVRVVYDLLYQALSRSSEPQPSDIPVELRAHRLKAGSCKDAEDYFVKDMREGLTSVETTNEGVSLLRKKTGARTALTTRPTVYNGVTLPVGSLLQVNDHGTYTFARLTPFAFDQADARDAFTWQYELAARHFSAPTPPSRQTLTAYAGTGIQYAA